MALRFVPKPEKAEIPFLDGSVLLVKRPDRAERRKILRDLEKAGVPEEDRGEALCEHYITGWREIIDVAGCPLTFTPENRRYVYELLTETEEPLQAFTVFLQGNLGNSQAGSTTSTITDGTQAPAADASKKE